MIRKALAPIAFVGALCLLVLWVALVQIPLAIACFIRGTKGPDEYDYGYQGGK